MKTFIKTQKVTATKMTRLEYHNLRGWELLAYECGSDDGFLIRNVQSGGIIMNWVTKEVFEADYTSTEKALKVLATKRTPTKYTNAVKSVVPREIFNHVTNHTNDALRVLVMDNNGCGNANYAYNITGDSIKTTKIRFQNGPINADDNGVNGISNESLIAILIDRLRGLQSGNYLCKANLCALTNLEDALNCLQRRTVEHMKRGVVRK